MKNNGLKILLVDDTVIVLQHLQSLLSDLEHVNSTLAVRSAEEGLGAIDNYRPDIMVLDISMPGMNGIEMLKRLSHRQGGRPVVIMLTNNIFSCYRDECMRLGATYFLDKSKDFHLIPEIIAHLQQCKLVKL